MQLTFLILVLCCCIKKSSPIPPPHSDSTWRASRYIIDNRRNALFSKKFQENPSRDSTNFSRDLFKPKMVPVEKYDKDLTGEASIAGPKFYRKYGENTLPRKIFKSLKVNGVKETLVLGNLSEFNVDASDHQKNSSGVYNPKIFMQNEMFNEVTSKTATTQKVHSWVPETVQDVLLSVTQSAVFASKNNQNSHPGEGLDTELSTTTSFPWELDNTKAEEGNQIDNSNEKHVYETRIETVSYHQEVIFNPSKKPNWFHKRLKQESENYEPPEKNYEEQEKRYESSEENYEEPEKNYELDEVMFGGRTNPAENEENQNKFGYVVEGTNYRKYRVEERTADGFIVGEYGVVSHDDGSLRGVRYTADSNINPQLIYETLIKFLSL